MNYTKIIFGIAVIVICLINFNVALKCYYCDSKSSCKKPSQYNCDQRMANATSDYLRIHYENVPRNVTSPYFECYRDYLKLTSGEFQYKGCIYTNVRGCQLALKYPASTVRDHSCHQCSNKNGCNSPAGRAEISYSAVIATVAVAFLLKKIWWNS